MIEGNACQEKVKMLLANFKNANPDYDMSQFAKQDFMRIRLGTKKNGEINYDKTVALWDHLFRNGFANPGEGKIWESCNEVIAKILKEIDVSQEFNDKIELQLAANKEINTPIVTRAGKFFSNCCYSGTLYSRSPQESIGMDSTSHMHLDQGLVNNNPIHSEIQMSSRV